jgi:hypothetical protein
MAAAEAARLQLSQAPVVRTPLDADGCELDKTPDGQRFVDPGTGVAFTQSALKRYCKRQARAVAAAAKNETRASRKAAAPAPAATPAVGLAERYADVVAALDELETELRMRHRPALDIRPAAAAVDLAGQRSFRAARRVARGQGSEVADAADTAVADVADEGAFASLTGRGLRLLALEALPPPPPPPLPVMLRSLDLSHNELTALPAGFGSVPALAGLTSLSLNNNWFREVPGEAIGALTALESLHLRSNFLRPNALALTQLKALSELTALDLRDNQKCGRAALLALLATELPGVKLLQLKLAKERGAEPGAFVGGSASERDALLLRAQLEPWGTTVLRRRLQADFGQQELEPDAATGEPAGRAAVMAALLRCYAEEAEREAEGEYDDSEEAGGGRRLVRVRGTPVPPDILAELLTELRIWSGSAARNRREREFIVLVLV